MQLLTTEDTRTALDKATKKELEVFAKRRGVAEIKPGMPAILMRKLLRYRGIVDIEREFPQLKYRKVGQQTGVNATSPFRREMGLDATPEGGGAAMGAEDEVIRQWLRDNMGADIPMAQPGPAPAEPMPSAAVQETTAAITHAELGKVKQKPNQIAILRAECKARGIKLERTDNVASLKAKLENG